LLDSTQVLDQNEELKQRIEDRFRQLIAQPRSESGPARDELLALVRAGLEA
jgi:hypothetical protein